MIDTDTQAAEVAEEPTVAVTATVDAAATTDEGSESNSDPDRDDAPDVEEVRLRADTLARRLHTELVRATGRLADPTDLPFDETHLEDPEVLAAAVDDLISRKPHLAARRPTGDIGQGATNSTSTGVDLAAILRGQAG